MAKETLLITGAGGFLGRRLCRQAAAGGAAGWRVVGLGRRGAPAWAGPAGIGWVRADLAEPGAAAAAVAEARPAAVIHAAANARTGECERDPAGALRDNVEATAAIAAACAAVCARGGAALVHCSTDLVFDGRRGMYREEDATGPVNVYGRTKLEAEVAVRRAHGGAIVCRLPLLVGLGGEQAPGFLDGWLAQMARGAPLTLFTDEYRSPLAVDDAAAGLLLVLGRLGDARVAAEETGGVLHLGGPERMNRYELGLLIRAAFAESRGVADAPLIAGVQADVPLGAPRAPDVSLDSSRAFGLGFSPRRMSEALGRMKERNDE